MSVFNSDNKLLKDCSDVLSYPFAFKIFKDTDLKVSLINPETQEETALVLGVDYEVKISRISDGGSIELYTSHPGYQLYAYRKLDLIQPEEVPTEGYFPESTIEDALDRGIMISQQLQEQLDRSAQLSGYSDTEKIAFEDPVDGMVLQYQVEGKSAKLINYDIVKEMSDFRTEVDANVAANKAAQDAVIEQYRDVATQEILSFETETNGTLTEMQERITSNQDENVQNIEQFKTDVNNTISKVSEAAEKIDQLEGQMAEAKDASERATNAANQAVIKADEATQAAATLSGTIAQVETNTSDLDNLKPRVSTNETNILDLQGRIAPLETFKNEFPSAVNLTTWARLADGNIYNIPFDDVKADTNRFIQFENTSDRRTLRFKKNTFIRLETSTDVRHMCVWEDFTVKVEDILDEGTSLTNGKDYSIFLVPEGDSVALKVSLNKTAPTGYDTENTRRIGGFHTECKNVGTVQTGNAMNGWLAGDIIPNSVWTLWHRPVVASPSGARYVPERDAWKTIYSQSGTLENTVFEYGATTTRSRTAWDHELDLALVGWDFPTSLDFTVSELGIVPLKAVNGKAESSCVTAGGWVNENGVRMVTSGGDESTSGGLWTILQERGPAGGSGWAAGGSNTVTKPQQYGTIYRLMGGGIWNSSGYAGPSSRGGGSSATGAYASVSARGWSRPLRPRM